MARIQATPRRSAFMKRLRRERTAAEDTVCKMLWSVGARYRRIVRSLPGTPDVANEARRKAAFVHGCFWHHHEDCPRGRIPYRSNAFWRAKLRRNAERYREKIMSLRAAGYVVFVVWECELGSPDILRQRWPSFGSLGTLLRIRRGRDSRHCCAIFPLSWADTTQHGPEAGAADRAAPVRLT